MKKSMDATSVNGRMSIFANAAEHTSGFILSQRYLSGLWQTSQPATRGRAARCLLNGSGSPEP